MKRLSISIIAAGLSALLFCPALAQKPLPKSVTPTPEKSQRIAKQLSKLPFAFEQNRGQTHKSVQFFSRSNGTALFLTPTEAVFSLQKSASKPQAKRGKVCKKPLPQTAQGAVLRMQLMNGNPKAQAEGLERQQGVSNYLIGNDRSKWAQNVSHFGKVRYRGVYRGIDLVYYGNGGKLEYDFVAAPHADVKQIGLRFAGAKGMQIGKDGSLSLEMGNGRLDWGRPVLYQEKGGKRVSVSGRYVRRSRRCIGIEAGKYDPSLPLTLDPALIYSTYLGGGSYDYAYALALDSSGNAYVAGRTGSTDFPTTAGAFQTTYKGNYDAFVTKLSADGSSLLYSTYLGGGDYDEVEREWLFASLLHLPRRRR
jgi:hypothetical protein